MADPKDEIARIIADAEREAYARGVRDTIARFSALEHELIGTQGASKANGGRRGRPALAINLVREVINKHPGSRGAEITARLEKEGNPVIDRTVRSCLRRLKESGEVWQRYKRWYPKKSGNENGEEALQSPH